MPPGTNTVHEVLAGYTALNPKTLPAWYRGVWDALLRQYSSTVVPAVASYKESSARFGARAREQYVADSGACAQVMRALMVFVKQHEKVQSLLGTGIAGCGKFVDVLVGGLPLWKASWEVNEHRAEFSKFLHKVQKGTRIAQWTCADGKARKLGNLAAKVPGVKKSIETLTYSIKEFAHSVGVGDGFRVQKIKHRNILGQEVASQLPDKDESESDGGSGDEGGGGEDEDEGEGGAAVMEEEEEEQGDEELYDN